MTLFNKRLARLLVPGFHPDPSVCSDRPGHLVMAFSSFEYFPGLPVWESNDSGETWSFCSHAASCPDQFTTTPLGNSQGFYAPTIRWHEGTYYLIVTDVNRGAMIFRATDPHGLWNGPVMVAGWPGIDPSLLFDDDGTCYICGNEAGTGEKPGIYAAPIDPDTGNILGSRHFLVGGITGSNPEGPHLYKRNRHYYLMWAEGGTEAGHMECMARADSVFGPYEPDPHNPIVTNRSTHLDPQCIGHADFAPLGDGSGDDFLVFLGLRTNADYPQQGWLGRENFGTRISWENGWPELADQSFFIDPHDEGCALPMKNPADEWICPGVDRQGLFQATTSAEQSVRVDMTPLAQKSDLFAEFDSSQGPRLIGRRQKSMDDHLTAVIPQEVLLTGVKAGLIVYANHSVWADASWTRTSSDGGRIVCRLFDKGVCATLANLPVRLPDGTTQKTAQKPENQVSVSKMTGVAFGDRAISLAVHGTDHGYSFFATLAVRGNSTGAAKEKPTPIFLGSLPCEPFASTHAGGFTGTLLGVYARTDDGSRPEGIKTPVRLLCR